MCDEQIEFLNATKDNKDCRVDILMSKIYSEINIDKNRYSKVEDLIEDSVVAVIADLMVLIDGYEQLYYNLDLINRDTKSSIRKEQNSMIRL